MFKKLALTAALSATAISAQAASLSYGWEDGAGTVLDSFGSFVTYSNTDALAFEGTRALLLEDTDPSNNSTPNATVGWVTGLTDGDVITASFKAFDTTAGAAPSVRIWAHYTSDPNDVTSYDGSANSAAADTNAPFSSGSGWEELSNTWTFNADGGNHTGLAIEVRLYDSSSVGAGSALIDDLFITSTGGTIVAPAPVPVPAAVWLFASGLAGMAAMRRKKKA